MKGGDRRAWVCEEFGIGVIVFNGHGGMRVMEEGIRDTDTGDECSHAPISMYLTPRIPHEVAT